ncbi:MAG: HAMP domain-containing sensor histidine kinase [Bacteroidia bacterium]|jgi:signal transduction histidine kinase
MSIRAKILLYCSIITIALITVVYIMIYTLFYQYREDAFQQKQTLKIETTLELLTDIKIIDQNLIKSMDQLTINSLYDEKLLIFDKEKKLIYSSIDDTPILSFNSFLNRLTPGNIMISEKDSLYDVVGIYLEHEGKAFYGISKAYDTAGYSTLKYIKNVLVISYFAISLTLIILLYYLSEKLTKSILHVTRQIKNYHFETNDNPIFTTNSKDEIALLVERFNELMVKMNKAYLFQKHAAHHISHELKTPIAVLVSNFEKIEKETDINVVKELLVAQKEGTKSLSDIINSLLEIAKVESGKEIQQSKVRVDELLYDISDELSAVYPDFHCSIEYDQTIEDESMLTIMANPRLLKAALLNLMVNCSQYSFDGSAKIKISVESARLNIEYSNTGATINVDEQQYLFQHFFRGENSKGKKGFGLGLVLVHKILSLHHGGIQYSVEGSNTNKFTMFLPLS